MGFDLNQDGDILELDFDDEGIFEKAKGTTKAKNFKKQMEHLKEVVG